MIHEETAVDLLERHNGEMHVNYFFRSLLLCEIVGFFVQSKRL